MSHSECWQWQRCCARTTLISLFDQGTPMYIARSVAAGHVWLSAVALSSKPMPTLLPEARLLYDKLHGPNRYKLYEDTPNATIHGGIPLPRGLDPVEMEPPSRSEFYHKLEYDAESVFWSLASALLRVQPQDESDNPTASAKLKYLWDIFEEHSIGELGIDQSDLREGVIFDRRLSFYTGVFLPCMHDVAVMFFHMVQQVRTSYGLMTTPPPHADHLHEAMQRLILNYLVEHRDQDIKLTPGVIRDTNIGPRQRRTNGTRYYMAQKLREATQVTLSTEASMPSQVRDGFQPPWA